MSIIKLIGTKFFKDLEKEAVAAVGVSLVKNKKVVTGKTLNSIRAETEFKENFVGITVFGGGGLPFIIAGKKAGTKYPVDYVGTRIGRGGRQVKVFKLKAPLREWKTVVGFGGSDFVLARAIAENPRKPVDIASTAADYLNKNIIKTIERKFGALLSNQIVKPLKDE